MYDYSSYWHDMTHTYVSQVTDEMIKSVIATTTIQGSMYWGTERISVLMVLSFKTLVRFSSVLC